MYNKVIIAGNLTRDIEVRYSQGGSAIANTAIASTRKFKSQTGEQKEEVLFVDLTFFGRSAEIANQYLKKGSKILVDGRLKLDQWTAQDGSKRSKHGVTVETFQMLDSKPQGGGQDNGQNSGQPSYGGGQQNAHANTNAPQNNAPQNNPQSQANDIPEIDINESEIPF